MLPRSYIVTPTESATFSSTFEVHTGMTITPAVGWYRAFAKVTGSMQTATATLTAGLAIFRDGTIVAGTETDTRRGSTATAANSPIFMLISDGIIEQTNAAHVWDVRWKTTDTGGGFISRTGMKPTFSLVQVAQPNV
jgi:hypothetical protein